MLIALVGLQWGDEGKGRVCDELSSRVDATVRFNGGPNSLHTVVAEGNAFALRQLPAGILHPHVLNILADGVVIDPGQLISEVEEVSSRTGGRMGTVLVSSRAHIITPHDRLLDQLQDSARRGQWPTSTWNGIGPAYSDKVMRNGIRVIDLLSRGTLEAWASWYVAQKAREIAAVYNYSVPESRELVDAYLEYGERLKPHIVDTGKLLRELSASGKAILFEGAQGAMLDLCQGTYPHVTSSNTTSAAAFVSAGIPPRTLDAVVGVMKPYVTRVGEGPLLTELKGLNVRLGEPYRAGWLDLVALRHACAVNGCTSLALTNVDRLSGFSKVHVAVSYEVGDDVLDDFPASQLDLARARPLYREFEGWVMLSCDTTASWASTPRALRAFVEMLESELMIPVQLVSWGPSRGQTILKDTAEIGMFT